MQPRLALRTLGGDIAELHIIVRIGKIDAAKDVTDVSAAANYNRRDGDTLIGKLRERLAIADKGDLVRITGRVRQTGCAAEGGTRYGVDMIANGFAILARSNGKPPED